MQLLRKLVVLHSFRKASFFWEWYRQIALIAISFSMDSMLTDFLILGYCCGENVLRYSASGKMKFSSC